MTIKDYLISIDAGDNVDFNLIDKAELNLLPTTGTIKHNVKNNTYVAKLRKELAKGTYIVISEESFSTKLDAEIYFGLLGYFPSATAETKKR